MNARPVLVIGLAGGTGSGKTTVSAAVRRAAGGRVVILPQDAYYRAQTDLPTALPTVLPPVLPTVLPTALRERLNYDEPGAFDTPLLTAQLDALVRGETVERPVYDFTTDDRAAETVRLEPQPVVVVEGILVLHEPTLRERFDLCVFVDAPPDERFIRRLERDVSERGRSAASVIEQYRRSVRPMHDLFVEPTKAYAHLIVPGCDGDSLLYLLDAAGVSCSTGSACQAGVPRPSHVLLAMGVSESDARGALRVTLGHTSTAADVDAFVAALPAAIERARRAREIA